MATISPDTIVCEFDDVSGRWFACFDSFPAARFDATVPWDAAHRLLEEMVAEPALYWFYCDPIEGMPEVAYRMIGWLLPDHPDGMYLNVSPTSGPYSRWPRQDAMLPHDDP